MASIAIQSLTAPPKNTDGFTYKDLHLDLKYSYTRNNELLKRPEVKDIVGDFDYGAIKNSIFNIFTTLPGQKILNPAFGLNLMQYLFRPCDTITATLIGQEIQAGLTKWEPRIKIQKIDIVAYTDLQTFGITLIISVPQIRPDSFQLVGTLSTSGFYFTN
jgi:phage baseplate assembly protein W